MAEPSLGAQQIWVWCGILCGLATWRHSPLPAYRRPIFFLVSEIYKLMQVYFDLSKPVEAILSLQPMTV